MKLISSGIKKRKAGLLMPRNKSNIQTKNNEIIMCKVSKIYKLKLIKYCKDNNIKNINVLIKTALDKFIKEGA